MFDSKFADAYILINPVNRFYFTNFKSSFGAVVLTKERKLFFTDSRYIYEAESAIKDFEIIPTSGAHSLYSSIEQEIKKSGDIKKIGYEDDYLTVSGFKDFKEIFKDFILKPACDVIKKKRIIKSLAEIEKIRTAQKISERALKKILPLIKPGISEKEIARELMFECFSQGAESMSFDTIIGFGENSSKPHHDPSEKKLEKNEVILIDFGVKYGGYCSDMTRTFCLGGPDPAVTVIHSIVKDAQTYALKHIKAGMTGREADSLAREYIKANGYGAEFSHSLGHGVGLNIHEGPRLSEMSDEILEENMVVTVEPGIYIKGVYGMRIEDMIVIKNGGNENLTQFDKQMDI